MHPDTWIVVAATGPAPVTRAALRDATRLVGPDRVLAYAALRRSVDALAGARSRVAEGVGRAGLLELLHGLPPEATVVHTHDDVALPATTLDRLLAVHARAPERLVVPWSNDLGTDHFAGPLPPARRAGDRIRHRAGEQPEDRVVHTVRPSVVVGRRAELLGLVPMHLAFPTTVLDLTHADCVAAAGAVVAHDGTCADMLDDDSTPDGAPLLVASLIVRDEAEDIGDCLASVAGLVDEIVVCDTGSVDDTVAIARAAGATVIEREWRDDFAWARNEALDVRPEAWFVLHIDADERLDVDDPAAVRRVLAAGIDHHDGYRVWMENFAGHGGHATSRWLSTRIFSPRTARFDGHIHERPVPRGEPNDLVVGRLDDVVIEHYGYTAQVISSRDKVARNLAVARAGYETDRSPNSALHYARSLMLAGEPPEERLEVLEFAHAHSGASEASSRAYIKTILAHTYLELGRAEEALAVASEAIELVPADDSAAIAHGLAAELLGRHEDVLSVAASRRGARSLQPTITNTRDRVAVAAREVSALFATGDRDGALRTAAPLLDAPDADALWEVLVRRIDDHDLLVDLARRCPDGAVFRACSELLPLERTVALCLDVLDAGAGGPVAVAIGCSAAVVRRDVDALTRLTSHVHLLELQARAGIAARLHELGLGDLAGQVLGHPAAADV